MTNKDATARVLDAALTDRLFIGQILICKRNGSSVLSHRDDEGRVDLQKSSNPEDALEIARYDDGGNYRPLKTAPNLRHGWQLQLVDLHALRIALDHFYPGRLAVFATWKANRLTTTPLRATLDRQSGLYRIAAKISNEQLDPLVANFCRSDGGCLRTILWKRDASGAIASSRLPPEKFDPARDQTSHGEETIPLLCQEMCNLLVAECRKVVKAK
ncbi:MAG: DR2241 family protein [Chthoniobacterales bacterium]